MTDSSKKSLFGLSAEDKARLMDEMRQRFAGRGAAPRRDRENAPPAPPVPDEHCRFEDMPGFRQMRVQHGIARQLGILNPFFACHEGLAKERTVIGGKSYLNFSTYDYLDLNGHPELNAAASAAMERHGTSASASRLVSGERPPHRALEQALAGLIGTEDALVFVSGHATNVSTLGHLFKPGDVIYHDALAHNSIILGAVLSGATRLAYAHNSCEDLERLLTETRARHRRAIIVTEGLFSMNGSIPDLPRLLELKKRHKAFLMVDEAHALGVLGATGRGLAEHFGVDPAGVDIWMGTLSKTLCGCGGFIAGSAALVEYLKFTAPGFVYSVGMSPPVAAASATALAIMLREPERVARLQAISLLFLDEAKRRGLDTGDARGYAIIPILTGNSVVAGLLAAALFERGINVMPIIYPAVEEGAARLRFFLSCAHSGDGVRQALDATAEELPRVRELAERLSRGV